MSDKLRLGPLPKTETVRLTISLPATVKADLDSYAALFSAAQGEVIDATALAPHMLAAFMDRDRAFRRARQISASSPTIDSRPRSISAASSITSEAADDTSVSE